MNAKIGTLVAKDVATARLLRYLKENSHVKIEWLSDEVVGKSIKDFAAKIEQNTKEGK